MKKKKIKLQVNKKGCIPKWIPPEKIMAEYKDFGITDCTLMNDPKWKKVKWIDFRVVVPDEYTRQQLLAAFEYIHDNNSVMDNDFIAINTVAHSYLTAESEPSMKDRERVIVDPDMFREAKQKTCTHSETYIDNGVKWCKLCEKSLEVTTYRD